MNVAGMINDRLNAPFTGPLLSDMTATADGAGEGRSHLTAKEIQDMESILRDGMVGYAYLYPHGEEFPQVYVFSMTPENIANFIGQHRADCSEMTLTDRMDMTVLSTYGEFIDKCPDRQLLQEVLQHLVPIQCGEAEPKEVVSVSRDTYDLYDDLLEEARKGLTPEDLKQAELSAKSTVWHYYKPGVDVSACLYLEAKWIGEKNLQSCKLENTPENLAAFIQQKNDVEEISFRDPNGAEVVIARQGYVHMCLDEVYLKNRLQPALTEQRRNGDAPVIQEADTPVQSDMKMEM